MIQQSEHIVTSFDDELQELTSLIVRMGGLVESQISDALVAFSRRDNETALACIEADVKVDQLEHQVDELTVKVLALRQPVADDLRIVVASLKIASDLERMGDNAKSIAKRTRLLTRFPDSGAVLGIVRMGELTQQFLAQVLDAYIHNELQHAMTIWRRDAEIDSMYASIFRDLHNYMVKDPKNITACSHLLFIAKNIERIGDHITNIVENLHFQIKGEHLQQGRPKGDWSSAPIQSE